jgi:hypothetical protein
MASAHIIGVGVGAHHRWRRRWRPSMSSAPFDGIVDVRALRCRRRPSMVSAPSDGVGAHHWRRRRRPSLGNVPVIVHNMCVLMALWGRTLYASGRHDPIAEGSAGHTYF